MPDPVNPAIIHGMYANDDTLSAIGFDDILVYIAIDHDDDVLYADIDRLRVIDWCFNHGYQAIDVNEWMIYAPVPDSRGRMWHWRRRTDEDDE
jgi:hypothetical protein